MTDAVEKRSVPTVERSNRRGRVLFAFQACAIVAVAAYLRIYDIDVRPPHSDESVNFLFTETTTRDGFYPYSHENYHGPLFFYIITAIVNHFGDSLLALRACSIACGVLLVVSVFAYANLLNRRFALLAGLFTALSPSLIFFSRYAIHESLLLLGENLLALAALWWWQKKDPRAWYGIAFSLFILISTKESFPIAIVSIGIGLLALGNWRDHWQTLKQQTKPIFLSYLLLVTLVCFVFSAGFRWIDGIVEMFGAIPQWVGRGSTEYGHFKPFLYYLQNVIWRTEPQLLLAFAAAVVFAAARLLVSEIRQEKPTAPQIGEGEVPIYFAVWTVMATLIYGIIRYKTVWLVVNITFPAVLFMACVLAALTLHASKVLNAAGILSIVLVLFANWTMTLKYNFLTSPIPPHAALTNTYPYGPENPFSYVHTAPGMLKLVDDVQEYWKRKPGAKVLIGLDGYFPLPYYFRHQASLCAYQPPESIDKAAEQYDIMILDAYKHKWSNPNFDQHYYRMSDYNESLTYFKKLPQ